MHINYFHRQSRAKRKTVALQERFRGQQNGMGPTLGQKPSIML